MMQQSSLCHFSHLFRGDANIQERELTQFRENAYLYSCPAYEKALQPLGLLALTLDMKEKQNLAQVEIVYCFSQFIKDKFATINTSYEPSSGSYLVLVIVLFFVRTSFVSLTDLFQNRRF